MLKSPEEYLSSMAFEPPEPARRGERLNAFERAFVEKYLGLAAYESITALEQPAPLPEMQPQKISQRAPLPVLEPKIEVAPALVPAAVRVQPELLVVAAEAEPDVSSAAELPVAAVKEETSVSVALASSPEKEDTAERTEILAAPAEAEAAIAVQAEAAAPQAAAPPLRDRLRAEAEVQMVSFYIENQLFLLPVAAIQEVIRHMELVKVPQAPAFVAGAINLRGTVMPIVHLASLLTNSPGQIYSEDKFIIICGVDNMRLGLIIDKISSMHLLPQNKLIWNAESKLGEAADFLYAIADLNDKVCGVVAPDLIAQKILAP